MRGKAIWIIISALVAFGVIVAQKKQICQYIETAETVQEVKEGGETAVGESSGEADRESSREAAKESGEEAAGEGSGEAAGENGRATAGESAGENDEAIAGEGDETTAGGVGEASAPAGGESSVAGRKDGKTVYLTFDDGPGNLTEQYLDILEKHQIRATFFVIGQQAEDQPEVLEREIAEGHEIGIHTYSHQSCKIYQSADAYYEDVGQVKELLEDRFHYSPQLWRFPWGSANCYICSYKDEIIARLKKHRLDYVDWNVSAEDSVGEPTVSSILKNIQKDCFRVEEPVVLMHDSSSNQATLDSLESIIALFEEQGYQFGTISERQECCHFGEY